MSLARDCRNIFKNHAVAGVLLAGYWLSGITASIDDSITSDELFHITAGYSYWRTGEFRLHPENGVLPQLIAGAPLARTDRKFDCRASKDCWKRSDVGDLGRKLLLYSGRDSAAILIRSRMVMGLVGVALGLSIYLWSMRIFGLAGAYASLAAFAFCPLMLSHGVYATSDCAAALLFLWATAALSRLFESAGWARAITAGLAVGGLALCKFNAPIILPAALVLIVIHHPGRRVFASLVVVLSVAWLVIWTAYGWKFAAVTPGDHLYPLGWEGVLDRPNLTFWLIDFLRHRQFLPEAWLYGMAHTMRGAARDAYLLGSLGPTPWYYFPVAALVKTPLATLIAAPLACVNFDRRARPLWILIGVYLLMAILLGPGIGVRHLLPVYAAGYILIGGVAHWLNRPLGGGLLAALALGLIAESALARPYYLSHFNPPAAWFGGHRLLADSNLDWGQDMIRLKRWAENSEHTVIHLALFGHYRFRSTRELQLKYLPGGPVFGTDTAWPLEPGVYCISANLLMNAMHLDPGIRPEYGRLYAHLRRREPAEWIGSSIAVYHVTAGDLASMNR